MTKKIVVYFNDGTTQEIVADRYSIEEGDLIFHQEESQVGRIPVEFVLCVDDGVKTNAFQIPER